MTIATWIQIGLVALLILSFLHKKWYWIVPYILLTSAWAILGFGCKWYAVVLLSSLLILKSKKLKWVYVICSLLFYGAIFLGLGVATILKDGWTWLFLSNLVAFGIIALAGVRAALCVK